MPTPKTPRILVIDDEPLIGSLIARLLGQGCEVVAVTRATDGLERLELQDDFDLVLCDLMMPDVTGMDVHAALVARGSVHAATMVFLTGGAFAGEAGQFLADVPNACLEKPFPAEELRAAVLRGLAGRRDGP